MGECINTEMPIATPTPQMPCASVSIDGLPMWPLDICFETTSFVSDDAVFKTTEMFHCDEGTLMLKVWDSEDCTGANYHTIDLAESDYDANCGATKNCTFATIKQYETD